MDCLMPTMCTDRTLTYVLNDCGRDEGEANNERYNARYCRDRFRRLFDYVSRRVMFPLVHCDALYSRLGMGSLWGEILYQIESKFKLLQ